MWEVEGISDSARQHLQEGPHPSAPTMASPQLVSASRELFGWGLRPFLQLQDEGQPAQQPHWQLGKQSSPFSILPHRIYLGGSASASWGLFEAEEGGGAAERSCRLDILQTDAELPGEVTDLGPPGSHPGLTECVGAHLIFVITLALHCHSVATRHSARAGLGQTQAS